MEDIIYSSFSEEKEREGERTDPITPNWRNFQTDPSIQTPLEDFNRLPFVYTVFPSCSGIYSEHPYTEKNPPYYFGINEHPFRFLRNTENRLLWCFKIDTTHSQAAPLFNDMYHVISSGEFLDNFDENITDEQRERYKKKKTSASLNPTDFEKDEFDLPKKWINEFSFALPFDVRSEYYDLLHLRCATLLEHFIEISGRKDRDHLHTMGHKFDGEDIVIKRSYKGVYSAEITVIVPLFDVRNKLLVRRSITQEQFDRERKAQIAGLHKIIKSYLPKDNP